MAEGVHETSTDAERKNGKTETIVVGPDGDMHQSGTISSAPIALSDVVQPGNNAGLSLQNAIGNGPVPSETHSELPEAAGGAAGQDNPPTTTKRKKKCRKSPRARRAERARRVQEEANACDEGNSAAVVGAAGPQNQPNLHSEIQQVQQSASPPAEQSSAKAEYKVVTTPVQQPSADLDTSYKIDPCSTYIHHLRELCVQPGPRLGIEDLELSLARPSNKNWFQWLTSGDGNNVEEGQAVTCDHPVSDSASAVSEICVRCGRNCA